MSYKRVVVFGSSGMLGRYVCKYMEGRGHYVIAVDRAKCDIASYMEYAQVFMQDVDAIVNCAGIIKQRKSTEKETLLVNSVFPHYLQELAEAESKRLGKKVPLIHISTDCVYDGKKTMYTEEHDHTAMDLYGRSKSIGEPEKACVVRTSIIGEEPFGQKLSFLEWAISQKGKKVKGFANHMWNGVTCLQLAKIINTIIVQEQDWVGVKHIFTPKVHTKFEMMHYFNEVYNLDLDITADRSTYVVRTLGSIYPTSGRFEIPELLDQLVEQKRFKLT